MDAMLGKISRLIVTVPEKFLGALYDFLEKLLGPNGFEWGNEFKKFLRKEPCWANYQPIVASDHPLDFIVHVDRTIKPIYPKWLYELMHPELELTGPADYDLRNLEFFWCHDDQKSGTANENRIYEELRKENTLARHVGFADLLAIQAKDFRVCRELCDGKTTIIFGWKSVMKDRFNELFVPCLHVDCNGKSELDWHWLDHKNLSSNDFTLRFKM